MVANFDVALPGKHPNVPVDLWLLLELFFLFLVIMTPLFFFSIFRFPEQDYPFLDGPSVFLPVPSLSIRNQSKFPYVGGVFLSPPTPPSSRLFPSPDRKFFFLLGQLLLFFWGHYPSWFPSLPPSPYVPYGPLKKKHDLYRKLLFLSGMCNCNF